MFFRMVPPNEPVNLTSGQVEELNRKLGDMRHDVNNCLSLITAAVEIIRRKPEMTDRMLNTVAEQPQKIIGEVRKFSEHMEKVLGIPPLS